MNLFFPVDLSNLRPVYKQYLSLQNSKMYIQHIAFWVKDLENMRAFYENYFAAKANEIYHNPRKQFHSYFLTFDSGAKLEIMHRPDITERTEPQQEQMGLTHLAFSLGSRQAVDQLTETLRQDGFPIVGEPRVTGDGFYESVILDPENNRIELTE